MMYSVRIKWKNVYEMKGSFIRWRLKKITYSNVSNTFIKTPQNKELVKETLRIFEFTVHKELCSRYIVIKFNFSHSLCVFSLSNACIRRKYECLISTMI